jgi:hypothetical protein
MILCGELYLYLGIKAMSLCVIVSQFEDEKAMALRIRNRQGKSCCNAFFLPKRPQGGFSPILLKSQSIRKAFYFVALCKQKDIKKGCFYERSIPNFRDNKKITIKYYSVI